MEEEHSEQSEVQHEVQQQQQPQQQHSSRIGCFLKLFSFITLEPAVFLCSLGFGIQMIIAQNLIIEKVCSVNLGFNASICANLSNHKAEQEQVQETTATIAMYQSVLSAVPGVIISLFLGPWSDAHGRKPLMILPMVGTILNQGIYVINVYYTGLKAEYILLSSLGSLFGGFTCFLVGIYSYISDVTYLKARTSRVAFLDLFVFLGFPVGVYVSGLIFKAAGFYAIFGMAALFTFLGSLYLALFITDTRGPRSSHQPTNEELTDDRHPLSIHNVVDVFKTCFKSRPHRLRSVILLLILAMLLNLSTFTTSNITYLYTRLKFGWTEQQYTMWSSGTSISTSLVTFSIMPLLSFKLGIHDSIIGIIGSFSGIASSLTNAFASQAWMLYLASVLGLVSTTPAIIIRSILSKVGPKNELGKIFSLVASLEACVPLFISPLMTYVYEQTLHVFPGAIFIVSTGLCVLIILDLGTILYLMTRPTVTFYDQLDEEQE